MKFWKVINTVSIIPVLLNCIQDTNVVKNKEKKRTREKFNCNYVIQHNENDSYITFAIPNGIWLNLLLGESGESSSEEGFTFKFIWLKMLNFESCKCICRSEFCVKL